MLIKVPGIGKRTAEEIIKRRKEKRLKSVEDLKGIRNVDKILKYITINGKRYLPSIYS
jgi:DNA uptake protein ComE-like DNA-binding protein